MTQSLEDYLEMVSFLSDDGEVRVTDIASRLHVSKPSVHNALKALEDQGLIEHERYSKVRLTGEGVRRAFMIRERHHILSGFLTDILGVDSETAEKDACKMEHLLSEETLSKMRIMLKAKK